MIMLLSTASDHLKQFFSQTSSDKVSLDEIYKAVGRDLSKADTNRVWLGNKLTYLRRYGLVEPVYNHGILKAIKLTKKGSQSLKDVEKNKNVIQDFALSFKRPEPEISIEDIMNAVPKLREKHPKFEIVFNVSLKNG